MWLLGHALRYVTKVLCTHVPFLQLAKSIKDKLTALHDGGSSGSAGAGAGTGAAAAEQQLKIKRLAQDFGSILQVCRRVSRASTLARC